MPDNNVAPILDDIPEPGDGDDEASGAEQTREAELSQRDPGAHEEKVQKRAEVRDEDEDEPRKGS